MVAHKKSISKIHDPYPYPNPIFIDSAAMKRIKNTKLGPGYQPEKKNENSKFTDISKTNVPEPKK